MNFNNEIAMNGSMGRVEVLREMRLYNGNLVTYEKFLKDYLRSMSFLYREVKANSKRYKKVMMSVEDLAKKQWKVLPTGDTV